MAKHYIPAIFLPKMVHALVDPMRPGVYLLGMGPPFTPGYVGRSDTCLRTRLSTHNHLGRFEYFIFRYARSPAEAFGLECEYWHALQQDSDRLANKNHPAPPGFTGLRCPYCQFASSVAEYFVA